MMSPSTDFKSVASADSAIAPGSFYFIAIRKKYEKRESRNVRAIQDSPFSIPESRLFHSLHHPGLHGIQVHERRGNPAVYLR